MGLSKDEDVRRAVDACLNCFKVCLDTEAECLKLGGALSRAGHITLLNSCAQSCMLSADYMLRRFKLNAQMCSLCAIVCDECAVSCETFKEDFMIECAKVCRSTADSCRRKANR